MSWQGASLTTRFREATHLHPGDSVESRVGGSSGPFREESQGQREEALRIAKGWGKGAGQHRVDGRIPPRQWQSGGDSGVVGGSQHPAALDSRYYQARLGRRSLKRCGRASARPAGKHPRTPRIKTLFREGYSSGAGLPTGHQGRQGGSFGGAGWGWRRSLWQRKAWGGEAEPP